MISPIDELHEWNRKMVEEFRATGGKPGGPFAGSPLLLLHTIGVRSGRERINPLMYQDLGDGNVAVFASANGAPTHPDWYHNLVANPTVTAEIGTETRRFRAQTATGDEREPIWSQQKQDSAGSPVSRQAPTGRSLSSSLSQPDGSTIRKVTRP